jgi:hypothetical protein
MKNKSVIIATLLKAHNDGSGGEYSSPPKNVLEKVVFFQISLAFF